MTDTVTPNRETRVNDASGRTFVWEKHRHCWSLVPESRLTPDELAAVCSGATEPSQNPDQFDWSGFFRCWYFREPEAVAIAVTTVIVGGWCCLVAVNGAVACDTTNLSCLLHNQGASDDCHNVRSVGWLP